MAIDISVTAASADDVSERRAPPSPSGSYACADCGYGITVAGALPACPMCGGDSWEPEIRADRGRPTHFPV